MGENVKWSRGIEFIMTLLSFAVGLGNIWRFPYLCFKYGGGVFLIPYILSLFVIGYPLLYLEIALGQFTGKDCLCCWDISPIFRGVGFSCICISFIIGIYYNVLVSCFLEYFYYSFKNTLPWTSCNNSWNINCSKGNESIQFFFNQIIRRSSSPDIEGKIIPGLTATYFVAWVLVFLSVIKSAISIGKISYITTILPYALMTILLIRGVTLKGSKEGIRFYLQPDISKLKTTTIWEEAANQIFFSLSTCCGGVITLASYNKYENNFMKDVIIVGTLNSLTSFYSGFAIFSATGHLAYMSNRTIQDVTDQESSLAFISYPASISALPIPQLWAVLFYLMMFCLGFGTMIATAEGYIAPIKNYFIPNCSKKNDILVRGLFCFISFLLGIPLTYQGGFYYVDILDNASSSGYLWVCVAELACVIYVYDFRQFIYEIELMTGTKNGIIWKAVFLLIAPLSGFLILISNYAEYAPAEVATTKISKNTNLWVSLMCIFPIPIYAAGYAIYCYCTGKKIIWSNPKQAKKSTNVFPL